MSLVPPWRKRLGLKFFVCLFLIVFRESDGIIQIILTISQCLILPELFSAVHSILPLSTEDNITNQDHRLSRWFALSLEGTFTSCACKRVEGPPSALLPQLPPLAAIFYLFPFTFSPVNGSMYSLKLI